MSNLYVPYKTPPGCHDVPFIYLFDARGLTNGLDYVSQLSQKVDSDSQFILRRIAGANSVAGFFSYRNASGSYVWKPPINMQGPTLGKSNAGDISVLPEKFYPENGQIRFDLLGVQKAVTREGPALPLAYIAFQGAKRFPYDVAPPPCPYRLRSYTYVLNIPLVDWTNPQYRRFNIRIDHGFDFELHRINQVAAITVATPPVVPVYRTGIFNYMLYDPNRFQLMSDPVPDAYIVDQISGIFTGDPAPMPGVFPCPGMLYPRMTQIVVDLYAAEGIPPGTPVPGSGSPVQIVFEGMERIPL